MSNLTITCTEKELAWDAWQSAFGAGDLLPHHDKFEDWWTRASNVQWKDLNEMMKAAWRNGVRDRAEQGASGFNSWWQQILDSQPVTSG